MKYWYLITLNICLHFVFSIEKTEAQNARSLNEALKAPNQVILLDLMSQGITQLPISIQKLQKLRYLSASFNQLTILPKEIGTLKALVSLNLAKNKLKSIPPEIG